jgi:hypothetical protein
MSKEWLEMLERTRQSAIARAKKEMAETAEYRRSCAPDLARVHGRISDSGKYPGNPNRKDPSEDQRFRVR